uniref:Protein kinase domain-containing protein n=1 Tax=Acrobeloides nanus TaxID=290746 RepID=A0A914DE83_9BILA
MDRFKRKSSYQNGTQTQSADKKNLSNKMFKMSLAIPSNNRFFHERHFQEGTFKVPTRYVFTMDRVLASGSQGVVIKAHDRVTHKDVVIKKMKNPFAPSHLARRTHREFVLSQIVKHENVIQLLSAFTPHDNLKDFSEIYIVTEFVKYPLSQIIHRRDTVFNCPDGGYRLAHTIRQLLLGIQHLHRAGILHRDLSVSNILVNEKFEIKIIDLGLARELPEDTQNVILSGYVTTRCYRAPEVALDLKYDKKVDVWSIGCIFGEILLGSPIFPGDSVGHWNKITQLLGSPNEGFLNQLPDGQRKYIEGQPKHPAKPWREIFPDKVFPPPGDPNVLPLISAQAGRDLLSKMLTIDPFTRISVENALEHPFVLWENEVDRGTPPLGRYTGTADGIIMTEAEWKALLFGQLKQYERDHCIFGEYDAKLMQNCSMCREIKCECAICNRLELNLSPRESTSFINH